MKEIKLLIVFTVLSACSVQQPPIPTPKQPPIPTMKTDDEWLKLPLPSKHYIDSIMKIEEWRETTSGL